MKLLTVSAICVIVILIGCSKSDSESHPGTSSKDTQQESFYAGKRDPKNRAVVVFVHGIFGDAHTTWTAPNGFYWPEELQKDTRVPPLNVFVYSFRSPFSGEAYTLDMLVNDFKMTLESNQIFEKYTTVVFVAHSMGGIVVRSALARWRLADKDILKKVPFIYQFSTPSNGSEIASLARALRASSNPQLASLIPTGLERSTELDSLESNWASIQPRPTVVYCAYEILKTYGVQVVEPHSAKASCDGLANAIYANHIDIVKPDSIKSKAYILLLQALKKIPSSRTPTPTSTPTSTPTPLDGSGEEAGNSDTNGLVPITVTVTDEREHPLKGVRVAFCDESFDFKKQTDSRGIFIGQVESRELPCRIKVQADCCESSDDTKLNPGEHAKTIVLKRKK